MNYDMNTATYEPRNGNIHVNSYDLDSFWIFILKIQYEILLLYIWKYLLHRKG